MPSDIPSIALMHPTLARTPFHRSGWVYEEKYDGWRMLVSKDGSQVSLVSRAGRDHTQRFPALVAALAKLAPNTLILDGDVRIFEEQLVSRLSGCASAP